MNQYELTTERKKNAVIQAALSLFCEKGFTSVTIKEIASLAKVSQVSIYNYFGNKEALVASCADAVISDTLKQALDLLNEDLNFVDKLKLALNLCSETLSGVICRVFTEAALKDSTLLSLLMESVNKSKINVYREYIERGKEEGVIDNSIPTGILLDYIDALNQMGSRMEEQENISEKTEYIHRLFLYGLIGKESNHADHVIQ